MSCETIVKMSDNDNATHKSVSKVCDNNLSKSEENSLNSFYLTDQIEENGKCKKITSVVPKHRQELLKWNGWGYRDSRFEVRDNVVHFTGRRYPIGELRLPAFTQWVVQTFNIDLQDRQIPQPPPTSYPEPVPCPEFLLGCQKAGIDCSQRGEDRLQRAHGQTLHDIHTLRRGSFARIPDVVVWPRSHQQTEVLVRLADELGVAVIPFGGGTSVSGAATCPECETRPLVALDTSQMNKLLWLDRDNLIACFESGVVGQDLERELRQLGLTLGHEPDSYEFSTLGGWVATRASGMKKNEYGNIEDLVVHVRMVTPRGVLERSVAAPRISCGPDWNHVILGSEGTLGVVTEVIVKVRPLPPCRRYGSIVFPNFTSGVACLREIAKRRCQPASIRLMDNAQFEFGQTLRPENSWLGSIKDALKHSYLTHVRGFDIHEICVATLAFEGESDQVTRNEKLLEEIAKAHGGIPAGQTNGERGYLLTFVIAYIRDLALEYYIVAESFETSVPWDRCEALCRNVKHRLHKECSILGIKHMMISCRVTQTYDSGACVYFYFAFNHKGLEDPVRAYEELEGKARDEILASGGSLSHHHGVGKLRSRWYPQSVSTVGVDLYHATKQKLDPRNVFACGNLLPDKVASKL